MFPTVVGFNCWAGARESGRPSAADKPRPFSRVSILRDPHVKYRTIMTSKDVECWGEIGADLLCDALGDSSSRGCSITNVITLGGPPSPPQRSLYDRLGGLFAIAAVVNLFSDEVLKSPLVGVESPNPQLRAWSREQSPTRLPGLKFMRTLWVADIAGGPLKYVGTNPGPGPSHLDLENAHRALRITPAEFDEVARILAATLTTFNVPEPEKAEVLAAFVSFKARVTAGSAGDK